MAGNVTFTMIKPGAVAAGNIGAILKIIQENGFHIAAMRLTQLTPQQAKQFYKVHEGKPFFGDLVDYLTSGPVVAMVLQADNCVTLVRKYVGSTKPEDAQPGTIRGDYCIHTSRNIIHASDSDESAEREIALWFKAEEIFDWKDCEDGWY